MKGARIVREIQIQNFRSLKDTSLQKLSPITLLVGENSSGKSTFLRAFPLIKQSINKRTSGPILWAGDVDDYVDFGSFEETVTNDGSNTITFRFKFSMSGLGVSFGFLPFESFEKVDEFAKSKQSEIDYEITITSQKVQEYVTKFNLTINSVKIQFDLAENALYMDEDFSFFAPKNKVIRSISNQNTRSQFGFLSAGSNSFGFLLPSIDDLFLEICEKVNTGKKEEYRSYRLLEVFVDIGEALTKKSKLIHIDESSKDSSDYPVWYVKIYNKILSMLETDASNRYVKIITLCYVYKVFGEIDNYLAEYFKSVHYIAPLRATAERYYRLRNLAVDEVDYQGKNLAIYINSLSKKRLHEFNKWTNEHFGFAVGTDKNTGHLSLRIKLQNSQKAVNLSDTGFGYSQVLPIITQLWELSSQKKQKQSAHYFELKQAFPIVIAIEQPELHLHPAVQAKLAKAFIAAIKLARSNGYELQLLLETHSQTIVDYLGRAVAKGMLNKDDVSVVLFEKFNGDSLTTVNNSTYDSDGYLQDWPYGFFDAEE